MNSTSSSGRISFTHIGLKRNKPVIANTHTRTMERENKKEKRDRRRPKFAAILE